MVKSIKECREIGFGNNDKHMGEHTPPSDIGVNG